MHYFFGKFVTDYYIRQYLPNTFSKVIQLPSKWSLSAYDMWEVKIKFCSIIHGNYRAHMFFSDMEYFLFCWQFCRDIHKIEKLWQLSANHTGKVFTFHSVTIGKLTLATYHMRKMCWNLPTSSWFHGKN